MRELNLRALMSHQHVTFVPKRFPTKTSAKTIETFSWFTAYHKKEIQLAPDMDLLQTFIEVVFQESF